MRQFFTSSLSSENLFENYYCNKNGRLKDQTKTTTSNSFSNVIFWCFDKLFSSLPVNFYLLNLNGLHAKIIFVVFCVKCIYPHILQKNMYVSIFKSILKNWLCIILFLIDGTQKYIANKIKKNHSSRIFFYENISFRNTFKSKLF